MIAILVSVLFAGTPYLAPQERRLVPDPTAPFHGLVVDADTEEPVAHTSVKVWGPGRLSEVCLTDESGRFATETEFAAGKIEVYPWDNHEHRGSSGRDWARVQHLPLLDGRRRPVRHVCRLKAGPRYELDCNLPAGASLRDYEVELRAVGTPPSADSWVSCRRAMLHAGELPWVRPTPNPYRKSPEILYLCALDGLSAARTWVPDNGIEPEGPLRMQLEPLGAIRGIVRESIPTPDRVTEFMGRRHTSRSAQVDWGIQLHFEPLGSDAGVREAFVHGAPIGRELHIGWIRPGLWQVELRSRYFPTQRLELLIEAGFELELDVELAAPWPTGTICIQVEGARGDIPAPKTKGAAPTVSFTLQNLDDPSDRYFIVDRAYCSSGISAIFQRVQRDGRWILEAVLEDVPEGVYQARPDGPQAEEAYRPGSCTVRAGDTARFTLLSP
jgi:hypothetical protein